MKTSIHAEVMTSIFQRGFHKPGRWLFSAQRQKAHESVLRF